MRTRTAPLMSLLLLGTLAAGCIGADENAEAPVELATPDDLAFQGLTLLGAEALPDFELHLTGCMEAIGVSTYNMAEGQPGPAEPFVRADISADTGDPLIGSYASPLLDPAVTGIWHAAGTCTGSSVGDEELGEMSFGWVGVRVEPPPWDDSGIERHYFIPDVSLIDHRIVKAVRDNARVHMTRMLAGGAEWIAPNVARGVIDDEVHGVFEWIIVPDQERTMAEMGMETMRFWLPVPADGTLLEHAVHDHGEDGATGGGGVVEAHEVPFRPVAIDVVSTPGTYLLTTNAGWGSHTRTDHHGPAGGAVGNTAGIVQLDFDRTITFGPVPNVMLNQTWLH